jgi:hypothetical protein
VHEVVQLTVAVAPPGLTETEADLVEAETYAGRRATLDVVVGMLIWNATSALCGADDEAACGDVPAPPAQPAAIAAIKANNVVRTVDVRVIMGAYARFDRQRSWC